MTDEEITPEVEEEAPADAAEEVEDDDSDEEEELSAADDLDRALSMALDADKEEKTAPAAKEEAKPAEPPLNAPPEWSKEEREHFNSLDRKGQEVHLRLHNSRNAEFRRRTSEYDKNRNRLDSEFGTYRQMADMVKPFIEAAGMQGKDPYKALTEAVAVVKAINTNPREALAAIAKLKNVSIAELSNPPAAPDAHVAPLQAKVSALEEEIAAGKRAQTTAYLGQVYDQVTAETNGAGRARFPDLNNTQEGILMAQRVGRLIRSNDFQEAVRSRNSNATIRDLVVEAYRWNGGRIDEATAPAPTSPRSTPQEHITRARRASASVPSRAGKTPQAARPKAKDLDTALEMALQDLEIG